MGLGVVGCVVCWRLFGLGLWVIVYDFYCDDVGYSFDELLVEVDIVFMYVVVIDDMIGMIGV